VSGISDSFQRPINYLRISVTDRCNLRCLYCMPREGISLVPHANLLTYEEIDVVVRAAAEMGINKVRLSGGEPLIRLGLVNLIKMLSQIEGIEDISLTTNGTLLASQAAELKEAGLRRVNISLDSLKRQRFEDITGYDGLLEVLEGIEQAHRVGLEPVKVNVVVMRGINDDELVDFALLSKEEGWHVRFIELMPLNHKSVKQLDFVSFDEMQQSLASLGQLEVCLPPIGEGPSKYYRLPGAKGTVGFITPISEHFCFKCNRLRLTAQGKLLPCLLSDQEIDMREVLRKEASSQEVKRLLLEAIASKPQGHRLAQGFVPQKRFMAQVGG